MSWFDTVRHERQRFDNMTPRELLRRLDKIKKREKLMAFYEEAVNRGGERPENVLYPVWRAARTKLQLMGVTLPTGVRYARGGIVPERRGGVPIEYRGNTDIIPRTRFNDIPPREVARETIRRILNADSERDSIPLGDVQYDDSYDNEERGAFDRHAARLAQDTLAALRVVGSGLFDVGDIDAISMAEVQRLLCEAMITEPLEPLPELRPVEPEKRRVIRIIKEDFIKDE